MRFRQPVSVMCVLVAGFVSLANHGCPQEFKGKFGDTPSGNVEPGDFHVQLETAYDATLVWTVQTPPAVQGPNRVEIEFPFPLGPFTKDVVGTHNVNEDFKNPVERSFSVRRRSSTQAYVDFFDDGRFDQGLDYEISLGTSPAQTSFDTLVLRDPEFNPTYKWAVHGGLALDGYWLDAGTDQFVFDIPVRLFFNNSTVQVDKNLLLLVGTFVLPHVSFGTFGGLATASGLSVVTEIVLTNAWDAESDAEVEFFNALTGEAEEVRIGSTTAHEHEVAVPALSSLTLEVSSSDPLITTWAFVYGDPPVEASTVFRTVGATGALPAASGQGATPPLPPEAGIAGTTVSTLHVIDVAQGPAGTSTAFAIVNPTSAVASMTLTLKDAQSTVVGQSPLVLQPRTQTARFFSELIPQGASPGGQSGFKGSLVVDSDTDVSVITLRTLDGFQTSSLTSGSQ